MSTIDHQAYHPGSFILAQAPRANMVCQADMPGNQMLDFIRFFFGFLFACLWGGF